MKRITIIAAAVAALMGGGSALADCNGAYVSNCTVDSPSNTTNNQGGTGIGVGVGIAGASANAAAAAGASASAGVINKNTNVGINAQEQGQRQGQEQGQLQGQSQSNKNYNTDVNLVGQGQKQSNDGNKQSTSLVFEAPNLRDLAPGFALGGLYPSANCHGTTNIGGSGPGFSIGFGTSWEDRDCGIRETARLFGVNTPDGVAVLCSSKYAEAAPSCQKIKAQKKAESEAVKVVADEPKKRKTADDRTPPKAEGGIMPVRSCVTDEHIARRMGAPLCQ